MRTTMRSPSWDVLTVLAWQNVAAHVLGLGMAAWGMSPGTPLVSLNERVAYLAGSPLAWRLGWATWMLCAVLLISFLACLTFRLGSELARLGLMIAVAGMTIDLLCDAVFIVVLPMIAAWQPLPEQLFLTVERSTSIASLVIANGAYSVAILLFSAALAKKQKVEPIGTDRVALLGYAVGAAGLILGIAGFTGSSQHAQWATPPTMGLFCVWVILVARRFG